MSSTTSHDLHRDWSKAADDTCHLRTQAGQDPHNRALPIARRAVSQGTVGPMGATTDSTARAPASAARGVGDTTPTRSRCLDRQRLRPRTPHNRPTSEDAETPQRTATEANGEHHTQARGPAGDGRGAPRPADPRGRYEDAPGGAPGRQRQAEPRGEPRAPASADERAGGRRSDRGTARQPRQRPTRSGTRGREHGADGRRGRRQGGTGGAS